jgi:hypothetical protein
MPLDGGKGYAAITVPIAAGSVTAPPPTSSRDDAIKYLSRKTVLWAFPIFVVQHHTTALAARMEDALRICHHLPTAPGYGAALCRRLHASTRRSHRPTGQIQRLERTQDWIKLGGKVSWHARYEPSGAVGRTDDISFRPSSGI